MSFQYSLIISVGILLFKKTIAVPIAHFPLRKRPRLRSAGLLYNARVPPTHFRLKTLTRLLLGQLRHPLRLPLLRTGQYLVPRLGSPGFPAVKNTGAQIDAARPLRLISIRTSEARRAGTGGAQKPPEPRVKAASDGRMRAAVPRNSGPALRYA